MNINWERFKTFYTVAKAGGIRRAADQHNKTNAAISTAISVFEKELQVKLFRRKENGIELTKEGESLFKAASHIANIVKAEEDILHNTLKTSSGHIQVIASSGFSNMYISNFIDQFLEENPLIDLEFIASNNLSFQEKLNADVLIHPYIENLKGYIQKPLIRLDFRLFASKEYIDKYGKPQTTDDLNNHKLIAFPKNRKPFYDQLNWHLTVNCSESTPRKAVLEIDENFGRCQLCAKGVGIITVPAQHPEVKKYNLVEILPELKGPSMTYYIIIDEVLYTYKKIQTFADFLCSKFS